jgi:hypothetical protein
VSGVGRPMLVVAAVVDTLVAVAFAAIVLRDR